MVIIPTEKRFDWQHAPVVLFGIVLLNVLLYFFYQVNDDEKIHKALAEYQENSYLELEWPVFRQFLIEQKNSQIETVDDTDLENFQQLYRDQDYEMLSVSMLIRQDFYQYLVSIEPKFSTNDARFDWLETRARINKQIMAISSLNFGLVPRDWSPVTLVSHQFLHGGLMHLMGNMFFLIICGFAVEAAIGHRLFLAFYLLSGIAGGLLYMAFNWGGHTPLVGASGAISGVMAMYLAVFRLQKIEFFYWFFIFVGYFRAPALFILPFYLGKEIISFVTDTDSNVAFMAHTGGFIVGGALVAALLWWKPNSINQEYIEKDEEIDPVQKKLAAIYQAIEKCHFQSALKLLNSLVAEEGDTFDWQLLRLKLAKIDRGDDFSAAQKALFNTRRPNLIETEKLQTIWLDDSTEPSAIDAEVKLKLALNFCQLDDLQCAEAIFTQLQQLEQPPESLGVLARKLSLLFLELNNQKKSQFYEKQAELLIGGER